MIVTPDPRAAEPPDMAQPGNAVFIAADIDGLVSQFISGNWIDRNVGGFAASMDNLALIADPIEQVVAWGVGWLIDYVQPLSEALEALAGDPDQIAAYAQTWHQAAAAVAAAGADLRAAVDRETVAWAGAAADAYRQHAAEQTAAMAALTSAADAIGEIVRGAALLVAGVRETVRDLIAGFVAELAVRLWQWLAEEAVTLGLATPTIAGRVGALVDTWGGRIRELLNGLVSSLRRLMPTLRGLDELMASLIDLLYRLVRGAPAGAVAGPDVPAYAELQRAAQVREWARAATPGQLQRAIAEGQFALAQGAAGPGIELDLATLRGVQTERGLALDIDSNAGGEYSRDDVGNIFFTASDGTKSIVSEIGELWHIEPGGTWYVDMQGNPTFIANNGDVLYGDGSQFIAEKLYQPSGPDDRPDGHLRQINGNQFITTPDGRHLIKYNWEDSFHAVPGKVFDNAVENSKESERLMSTESGRESIAWTDQFKRIHDTVETGARIGVGAASMMPGWIGVAAEVIQTGADFEPGGGQDKSSEQVLADLAANGLPSDLLMPRLFPDLPGSHLEPPTKAHGGPDVDPPTPGHGAGGRAEHPGVPHTVDSHAGTTPHAPPAANLPDPPPAGKPALDVPSPHQPRIVDNGVDLDTRTAGKGLIDSISGTRLPDGRHSVTIEGELGPKIDRFHFEKTGRLLPQEGYELAHLWGRRFGDEAAAGIKYAEPGFNKSLQTRVENTIENFATSAAEHGNIARLKATAVSMPNPDFLDHVTYRVVETTPDGRFVEGFTVTIDHQGVISEPGYLASP